MRHSSLNYHNFVIYKDTRTSDGSNYMAALNDYRPVYNTLYFLLQFSFNILYEVTHAKY